MKFLSAKFGLPSPPPDSPEKGPNWGKTVQISGNSSKLTLFSVSDLKLARKQRILSTQKYSLGGLTFCVLSHACRKHAYVLGRRSRPEHKTWTCICTSLLCNGLADLSDSSLVHACVLACVRACVFLCRGAAEREEASEQVLGRLGSYWKYSTPCLTVPPYISPSSVLLVVSRRDRQLWVLQPNPLFGVSRWSPFSKSIRSFSVMGLTMNSD